ncbi:MAG TPA: hypothetical protein VES66_10715 [Terriglobales bacterium]|nr:hypothetical protein [Terriglobales bacterium]
MTLVVMVGMTLAMSSPGLAQQETLPDQFLGADEIRSAQPVAQQTDNKKVANSHRQPKTRKQKQLAKQNASDKRTVAAAWK